MKKIILSADDFGRSRNKNKAIDYAMKKGLIKSAALLVGSSHTEEALQYAFSGGYIDRIHCHLNLFNGRNMNDHFIPMSELFRRNVRLCYDGEFKDIKYHNPKYYRYHEDIFDEIEAQYNYYKRITKGQANYNHIDFHLYYNMALPVSYAYSKLIKKYGIKSARYYGEHHKDSMKGKIKTVFSVCFRQRKMDKLIKACNADYYITMREHFRKEEMVEVYVHPDYIDNTLFDNSYSAFGHEKKPLEYMIDKIKGKDEIKFISWAEV